MASMSTKVIMLIIVALTSKYLRKAYGDMIFRPRTVLATLLMAALAAVTALPVHAQALSASSAAGDSTAGSATPADSALRSRVEQLEKLVLEQQRRIEALEARTGSAIEAAAPSGAAVPSSAPAPTSVAQANVVPASNVPAAAASAQAQPSALSIGNLQAGSTDERIRNLEREIKGLGPISFSGDVRVRAEPFFGGPTDESLDRAHERVRVRFNALADLGSQFRTGITLASGDVNDPTSTNQTLTGFYTRKPIALDQAFVEFTPDQFKPLTVVAGKFRYPWYNTELTWDKDLNPDGAAETLAFKVESPVLKRIAFIGFQLPFAEVAGTAPTDKRITQQITYGGQIQTLWQISPRVSLGAYSALYDYRGTDSIAYALARASSKNPQTPFVGLLPLASGNPVQDSTYTTTATSVVTVAGTAYPTGVSTITNAQFASKFQLFDNIARLDIDTGHSKYPISFIGDYVQNIGACGNLANIVAAPANTATQSFKQTVNAPCVSNQRRGYWAEARIGRLQEKHDIQFGYTHMYIEREAVLGNFNYSDIRQGTNVTQHRFDMFYQLDRSVQDRKSTRLNSSHVRN